MSNALTHIETEKQLVPSIRFNGYESIWPKVSMKSVVKASQGLAILRSNRFEEDGPNRYNYITIPYLLGGECLFIENPQESVKCKEDDVIVTRTGSGVGQIWTGASGVIHNNFFKVSPVEGKVRKDFIYHFLLNPLVQKKMKSFAGSSAIPDLNHSEFYLIPFNLPSLPEQQKIASFLSAVDEKIQQLTKKKALLEHYKKGVMQQLFSSQLRFKDENGKAYPDWEEKTLLDVASFRRGSFPQPYGLPEWYDDNGAPFVQVYDVAKNMLLKPKTKQYISEAAQKQSVFVKKGTLVLTIQGSIGRLAKTQYDAYVDRTLLIFQSYKVDMDIDYFKYVVYLLFEIEKTRAPGGTIKTITKEKLSSFNVNIPCLEEQQKIASYLSGIDTKIEAVNNQITQTQTFKKGLLQQMFV